MSDSSESFDVVNDRWQNVLELERAVANAKFAGNAADGALEAFLNEATLMSGDDVSYGLRWQEGEHESAGAGAEPGVVSTRPPVIQLMTCHKSKGLEFNTVFLTGVEEGTFPPKGKADGELDEERRLMCVLGGRRWKSSLVLLLFAAAATAPVVACFRMLRLLEEDPAGGSWLCRDSRSCPMLAREDPRVELGRWPIRWCWVLPLAW